MHHAVLFNVHSLHNTRPVGPYRVATVLREHGWTTDVLEWASRWTDEQLQEFCKKTISRNTVFVGFAYFYTFWDIKFDMLITWIREKYPHIKIIVGGQSRPLGSITAKVDYYIFGYGESAILELAKSFVGNTRPEFLKLQQSWLSKGKKVIDAIHDYPAYPLKSLMVTYDKTDYLESWEWPTIEFSRGCKFQCAYCNFPIIGVKGDYTRDADDYQSHVQSLYDDYGIDHYYVADETFNDRTEKIIKFADATKKLSFKPFMTGFIRADLLVSRPGDKEHLARLGLLGHYYGVETFHHKAAKLIGKGMNPDRLKDGLIDIKNYFQTHGQNRYRGLIALIVGLPTETQESVLSSYKWLEKNWQGQAVETYPLEIPTNEFTDKLSTIGKDWKKWGYEEQSVFHNTDDIVDDRKINALQITGSLNWKNDQMDYDTAKKIAHDFHERNVPKKWLHLNPYMLDYITLRGGTIDDALSVCAHELYTDNLRKYSEPITQKYIEKKLNG
jgi:hypothetical protein